MWVTPRLLMLFYWSYYNYYSAQHSLRVLLCWSMIAAVLSMKGVGCPVMRVRTAGDKLGGGLVNINIAGPTFKCCSGIDAHIWATAHI